MAIKRESAENPEASGFRETAMSATLGLHVFERNSAYVNVFGPVDATLVVTPCSTVDAICSKGVMPQIGSLANGKLYEIAPTSLPSIYTGEPDIPAKTNVRSAFAPLRRPTIISCFGPIQFGITPSISTLNSSGFVPLNTVRAVPCIPSRSSETGKIWGDEFTAATGKYCEKILIEKWKIAKNRARNLLLNIVKKSSLNFAGYGNILDGLTESLSFTAFTCFVRCPFSS